MGHPLRMLGRQVELLPSDEVAGMACLEARWLKTVPVYPATDTTCVRW